MISLVLTIMLLVTGPGINNVASPYVKYSFYDLVLRR